MKKLIMSGQAVVNYLGEHDELINSDCITPIDLYLEDEEFCRISLTLNFPDTGYKESMELFIWYHYHDDSKIQAYMDDPIVKLSEDELFINFRITKKVKKEYTRFRCVARLKGTFPPNILEGGAFFDLSGFSVKERLPEQAIPLLAFKVPMKGMIHLNYNSMIPFNVYFNSGECQLLTDAEGIHYLRFPCNFPEFHVDDIEITQLTENVFEGREYSSLWYACIQLSMDELLIGFTIFDDRENYPDCFGGVARLQGVIPSNLPRKILM